MNNLMRKVLRDLRLIDEAELPIEQKRRLVHKAQVGCAAPKPPVVFKAEDVQLRVRHKVRNIARKNFC